MRDLIVITGSSGFLGSALCVALSQTHMVAGIDFRPPNQALRQAAPTVRWYTVDIRDKAKIEAAFNHMVSQGFYIAFVFHLAVYYHYGAEWQRGYEETNIEGTLNLIEACQKFEVGRFVFAASIASLVPPESGAVLTESSCLAVDLPYSKSKAIGEWLLSDCAILIPTVIVRIGGVFSDWCELPPLYSLIKHWSNPYPWGRWVPGRGKSGFPYIHKKELIGFLCRVIDRNKNLARLETLFAAENVCTCHNDLFPLIRKACAPGLNTRKVSIPVAWVRFLLRTSQMWQRLSGRPSFVQPWMADYIDRPLHIDTRYTRRKLQWHPRPGLSIRNRLPILIHHFVSQRRLWEQRNLRRNQGRYEFYNET